MLRQSFVRHVPRTSLPLTISKQLFVPVQARGYADAPPKQVKGAFLGKKNKDVCPLKIFVCGFGDGE
jgi:hypothetical protein